MKATCTEPESGGLQWPQCSAHSARFAPQSARVLWRLIALSRGGNTVASRVSPIAAFVMPILRTAQEPKPVFLREANICGRFLLKKRSLIL